MNILADPARRLSLLLWLVALHSAAVGIGLILHPADLFALVGYAPVNEPFFPVQGGVFHVVMAVGYALAARNLSSNRCLIAFAILVKTAATFFLLIYWLMATQLLVVLLSGIADGIMAVLIWACYRPWRRLSNIGGLR